MRGQAEPIPTDFPGILEIVEETGWTWQAMQATPAKLLMEILARRKWRLHWQAERGRVDAEHARQLAALKGIK